VELGDFTYEQHEFINFILLKIFHPYIFKQIIASKSCIELLKYFMINYM
jgi:hypothetical protein